jgi:hypothetical protein
MVEAGALGEAVVFLSHFKDMQDPRQRAKVIYPLDEVLLLCLLAVLAGSETFVDIARFGEKSSTFCAGSGHFCTGHPAMITLAIFLHPSMPRSSSAASSPGWRH